MISRLSTALRSLRPGARLAVRSDVAAALDPATLRTALVGKSAARLAGRHALFVGDQDDVLLEMLLKAGLKVTCWTDADASSHGDDGIEFRRVDFSRPWANDHSGSFDAVVSRSALGRSANPLALLHHFRQLAPLLCIDYTLAGTPGPRPGPNEDALDSPAPLSRAWLDHELSRLGFHTGGDDAHAAKGSKAPDHGMIIAQRVDLPRDGMPLLVHVHMPKNGGSSVKEALINSFGPRYLSMYLGQGPGVWHDYQSITRTLHENPGAQVISSHSFREFPAMLGNRIPLYMCFLRHPVERHHSYYRYCRKDYDNLSESHRTRWLPPDFMDMSMEEFFRWMASFERKHNLTPSRQVQFLTRNANAKIAIDTLRGFFMVGITEQLERGMQLLQRKLAAYDIELALPETMRANITKEPGSTEMPEWDESLGSLAADWKLYDWGCGRFEREAEEWGV